MLAITVDSADLSRIRLGTALGPQVEGVQAMGAVRRGAGGAWGARVRRRQSAQDRAVLRMLRPMSSVGVDLHTLSRRETHPDRVREAWLDSPSEWLSQELGQFRPWPDEPRWLGHARAGRRVEQVRLLDHIEAWYEQHVADEWPRVHAVLVAQQRVWARRLAEGGLGSLLDSLDPRIDWDGTHLRLAQAGQWARAPLDVGLDGRGLVIVPSYFAQVPEPYFPIDTNAPPILLVPVPREPAPPVVAGRTGLAAALGRPRAELLALLAALQPLTTSELAEASGMAVSSASEHAAALRAAGLVHSRRDGQRVLHMVTDLGSQLADRAGRAG